MVAPALGSYAVQKEEHSQEAEMPVAWALEPVQAAQKEPQDEIGNL